ncbi:hypothetical protein JCM10212_005335, partial [Sporobolomyces blumeae]
MAPQPTKQTVSALPGSTAQHFALDVEFPVYSIQWTSNDTLILAGGGGSSRTGVNNRLSMYKVDKLNKQLDLVTEHQLSKHEDAPMTIAVDRSTKSIAAGINSDQETLDKGTNENLRIFHYDDDSITYDKRTQTINSTDPDQYQKVTAFSRPVSSSATTAAASPSTRSASDSSSSAASHPLLLAVGTTNSQLSLVAFPSLEPIFPSPPSSSSTGTSKANDQDTEKDNVGNDKVNKGHGLEYDGEEVFDVDFDDSGEMLVGTSSTKLCVWPTRRPPSTTTTTSRTSTTTADKADVDAEDQGSDGAKSVVEPLQVIERPVLKKELACTFRAAKFGRMSTASNLYTVVNSSPSAPAGGGRNRRKNANQNKKSFVSLWDTNEWKLGKTRTVGLKPVTSFDVSEDGTLLAYGSSDLSIGILDAVTLR